MRNVRLFGVLVCVVVLLVIVSGCSPTGNRVLREDAQRGVSGLDMKFFQTTARNVIVENSNFDIVLDLHNRGAYTILYGQLSVQVEEPYVGLRSIRTLPIRLAGRSNDFPDGEFGTFIFPARTSILDQGSVRRNTVIYATACFDYQTILSTNVCVDTDPYNQRFDASQKACQRRDISGGGQGAPIVISRVELQTYVQNDDVYLPQFVVHVRNAQNGLVFDHNSVRAFCNGQDVAESSFNKIYVHATLSDVQMLCGSNNELTLVRGEGRIVCGLVDQFGSVTPISNRLPTYEAPLHIELTYGYSKTISQSIDVQSLN